MVALTAVLGDLPEQDADAIVDPANAAMRGGGGLDGVIHRRGGPAILRDCEARFPRGLAVGHAGWTTGGDLAARWVIHAVVPDHAGGRGDRGLLDSCYRRSLEVADELGARTVAFPLLGAGARGWPRQDAAAAAVETLAATPTRVEEIRIVTPDQGTREYVRSALARWTPLRILQGVRVLHRRGFHRVRVLPRLSPSGVHWRVSLFGAGESPFGGDEAPQGLRPIEYSTAAFTDFAGGDVSVVTSPDAVATLILAALPALAATADDPGYVAWYADLLALVEREGRPPVAFGDDVDETPGWEVGAGSGVRHPPPPA